MNARTKSTAIVAGLPLVLALTGCASPKWQHTQINDPTQAARQLVIDQGYCTRVALGAAPMSQIVTSPTGSTSHVTMQGTTINPMTGQSTYGTYTGQVTTNPSNSFATGFANGMNMGSAINAQVAQASIHKSCMFAKGWSDTPTAPVPVSAPKVVSLVRATAVAKAPSSVTPIYANPTETWEAETEEFLQIYPAYSQAPLFDRFNARVKIIAVSDAGRRMSGPQILMMARKEIIDSGFATVEAASKTYDLIRSTYRDAVRGDPLAQAGLGLLYSQGSGSTLPINRTRSAWWSQQSAVAGNPVGQMGYGILRFGGGGVQQDRVDGYRWIQKAAVSDSSARELLRQLEASMSAEELALVR